MSEPVVKLEVALATDPTVATPIWADLTAWWLNDVDWSSKFGRRSEREAFQAGTASFRLDNADRRFDPLNTAGPYYDMTVTSTLTAAVASTTATTITVASSASFPTDEFELVVGSETMLVTAGFGTTTLTVTRGYDGSTATTHLSGASVTWYTPGLLPDRRVRATAKWNLLSELSAAPTPSGIGTWLNKSGATVGLWGGTEVGVTQSVAGQDAIARSGVGTANQPAEEGGIYTAIASARRNGAFGTLAVGIEFLNAGGFTISTTWGTAASPDVATLLPPVTAVAPPGTAHVSMLLKVVSLGVNTGLFSALGLFPTDTAPAWSRGGPYDLFSGYVEGWPQTWEDPGNGYVDVALTDAFEPFNLTRLDQSPYEIQVRKSNPTALWLLADEVGATVAREVIAGRNGTYESPRTAGSALIAADPRTGLGQTYETPGPDLEGHGFARLPYDARPTASSWSVTWLAETDITVVDLNDGLQVLQLGPPWPMSRGSVAVYIGGESISLSGADDAFNIFSETFTVPPVDVPRHYGMTFNGTQLKFYVDGVLYHTFTPGSTMTPKAGTFDFGLMYGNAVNHTSTVAALAVFDGVALSAGTLLAHTAAAFAPWDGDTTGARIGRILDAARWSTTNRTVATGDTTLGPVQSLVGSTALAEIQATAEAEGGAFYVTPAGVPTFRNRRAIYLDASSTTPVATFSDNPGVGEYALDASIQPQLDTEFVITEARVKRTAGDASEQAWTSPTRSRHFTRSSARTLNLRTDAEALSRAQWDVNLYGEAKPRIDALTLHPSVDQTLWPIVLGLRIGDRIRVVTTPLGSGNQVTIDGLIEGRDISVSKDGGWLVTFRLNTRETVAMGRWDISTWDAARWAL